MNEENLKKITALRHELHAHPELSMQEKDTARRIRRFLQDHTTFQVVDCGSWFYAVKPGRGEAAPAAFRAELDALPISETISLPYGSRTEGVSHKCGHDGHCAALCGLALELDPRDLPRTVYLLFQPGEEIGRGAEICAGLLAEKEIREIYAFHNLSGYPEGSLVYRHGLTQPASEGLQIHMTGRPCHASAPEEGINPAPALAELTLSAAEAGKAFSPRLALCTLVGLRAGTGDFGVSAGEGEIRLTLRAEREEEMQRMEKEILARAQRLADRDGMRMEQQVTDRFPETKNEETCLGRVLRCARQLGIPTREMESLWRASEDFGTYTKQCPGAIFYLGSGENYPPLHTPGYDFPDTLLPEAVDLFTALACESLPG